MHEFLYDVYNYMIFFGQFISKFSTSLWVYPIVFFFFVLVFFYLITDNK